MRNRFVFLICSFNNEKWVQNNLNSILCQTYDNWIAIYYNDASTDRTYELVKTYANKDKRIHLHSSSKRQLKTGFLQHLSDHETIQDNDIVCVLDGDDFLANEDVLHYLNEVYIKANCWITYGGMIIWNGGENIKEPYPQNTEPPFDVKKNKLYRKDLWRYSHFRTYRGFLWNRIKTEDWIINNQYGMIEDLITMYPCLEMCPMNKIFRIDQQVYILNYSIENGESRGWTENKINNIGQIQEIELRNRQKYSELSVVSPTLVGGLGNQMFEIAAAAALAKDNDAILVINPTEHNLPNQGRNVNVYMDNVFSKIIFDNNPPPCKIYKWDHIYYKPIPYTPNLKLVGHNQSYKYFDHHRKYIQDLFSPTEKILSHLDKQYNIDMVSKATIIQVRRGDYIKFPEHLPMAPIDYYTNAVKLISPNEVWVCSDDIEWCKENLRFECDVKFLSEEDYITLYLISLCKNVIISNSSFGWWGCYLNKRSDKNIYVPSQWFGKILLEDGFKTDDLILPDWNIL
jgi:glycosyltransferase involved in cell wall biosynthesis